MSECLKPGLICTVLMMVIASGPYGKSRQITWPSRSCQATWEMNGSAVLQIAHSKSRTVSCFKLDEPSVAVTVAWKPQQPYSYPSGPPIIKEFLALGAACPAEKAGFRTGDVLNGTASIVCRRLVDSAMAFILETTIGSAAIHLPRLDKLHTDLPRITSLRIPENTQNAECNNQQGWSVKFPLGDAHPDCRVYLVAGESMPPKELELGGRAKEISDHKLVAPRFPEPTRASFTYEFERSATVAELEVSNHDNGMAKAESFLGDSESDMVSLGEASQDSSCEVSQFFEGQHCIFTFPNPKPGKFFRTVIREINSPRGFAIYRAYPREVDHHRFPVLDINYVN